MCTEGKCCCLKLETGTLIYGVIVSVFNALLILVLIVGLIAQARFNHDTGKNRSVMGYSEGSRSSDGLVGGNVRIILSLFKSGMDLTFSVLLCTGVTKRRPSYIKAYFIYGIVIAVLYSIIVVMATLVSRVIWVLVFGIFVLIFYVLILHMVKLTHEKLSSGKVYGCENVYSN